MAKIYSGIQGITKPKITSDWQKYDTLCEKYVDTIKKWAKDYLLDMASKGVLVWTG